MPSFFRLHIAKIAILLIIANVLLLIFVSAGGWKSPAQWSWADIIGEGGACLLTFTWLGLILNSRPAGRITTLLTLGLGLIFLAWWVDTLDELIALPDAVLWDHWLESGTMSAGLVLLTYGLYHWHLEQLAISAQRQKQERWFRNHRQFDQVTPLANADYLKQQIKQTLPQAKLKPTSLVALDLDHFDAINQRYSHREGDRVLQGVSQLLLLNLRNQDLLCRLAGDRFVVLLPNTGERQAQTIADELEKSIATFAYRSHSQGERLFLSASSAVVMAQEESSEQLIERLQRAIAKAKNSLALQA